MCNVSGAYVLDSENLPDLGAIVDGWDIKENNQRLVEDSAAAIATDFLLHHGNNRGHDSAGIVARHGDNYGVHKGKGFSKDVFSHDNPEQHQGILQALRGNIALGHDRYATKGGQFDANIQPFGSINNVFVSHNGNYVNEKEVRELLGKADSENFFPLQSTTDTELSLKSIAMQRLSGSNIEHIMANAMWGNNVKFLGASSTAVLMNDKLIAFRDPYGFWPLHVAQLNGLVVVNSEITPISELAKKMGYKLRDKDVNEVGRGEMVLIDKKGIAAPVRIFPERPEMRHFFDFVYLRSHEDPEAKAYRQAAGELMWNLGLAPKGEYVVAGVPNSGVLYAKAFAKASGLPYDQGLITKNIEERTFLSSTQRSREAQAKRKYNYLDSYKGAKLILFDDSAVRYTTQDRVMLEFVRRGADEVHFLIGSAPQITPDFLGIHTPSQDEHGAYQLNTEEKRQLYVECRGHGVEYGKPMLVDKINQGVPVEEIIRQSASEGKNILSEERRVYRPGRFSMTYLPGTKENPLKHMQTAFSNAGINPDKLFMGTMMPAWDGYPAEFVDYLPKLQKAA